MVAKITLDDSACRDRAEESAFAELVSLLAPGPYDVIMITHSFFDESYGDGKNILCVAGYTFTGTGAQELDRDWRRMLRKYGDLPFFRMSACNQGEWPFDKLSDQECIAIATEAINLIGRYAVFGNAVTVDEEAFGRIITTDGVVSTPYELCAWLGLTAARSELGKIWPVTGMSFFFEEGFKHQAQADRMMKNIFESPELKAGYAYKARAFVQKEDCTAAQAADLLAWQCWKDFTRRQEGKTRSRGDLKALLSKAKHWAMHVDEGMMKQMVSELNRMAGSPLGNEIAGIAVRNPKSRLLSQKPGVPGSAEEYEKLKAKYPERFTTPKKS
jgi:hypothetical protein